MPPFLTSITLILVLLVISLSSWVLHRGHEGWNESDDVAVSVPDAMTEMMEIPSSIPQPEDCSGESLYDFIINMTGQRIPGFAVMQIPVPWNTADLYVPSSRIIVPPPERTWVYDIAA